MLKVVLMLYYFDDLVLNCIDFSFRIFSKFTFNAEPKSHAASSAGSMMVNVITKKLSGEWSIKPSLLLRLNVRSPVNLKKE